MTGPILSKRVGERSSQIVKFRPSVIEPLKDAVAHLQALGDKQISLAGELAKAVAAHVSRMADDHNAARPFPRREQDLPPGRKVKAKR